MILKLKWNDSWSMSHGACSCSIHNVFYVIKESAPMINENHILWVWIVKLFSFWKSRTIKYAKKEILCETHQTWKNYRSKFSQKTTRQMRILFSRSRRNIAKYQCKPTHFWLIFLNETFSLYLLEKNAPFNTIVNFLTEMNRL